MRKRVVICEFMGVASVAAIEARFATLYDPDLVDRRNELLQLVAGADGLIVRNRTAVDRALLDAAPKLAAVGRLGVGLDNIDVAECARREIEVLPATGANALAVAEYVIATAMFLLRGAYASTAAVAAGEWPRARLSSGRELAGKTLGVVGFGSIGRRTAALGRALGMTSIAFDPLLPSSSPVWAVELTARKELDEVLASADVVSLHVPLTPETRGLVGARRLASMKRDAILVNTARGGIIDEAALAQALAADALGGAALDVFSDEPLRAESPFAALASSPRLLLTPHVAGVTRESNERVSAMVAERMIAALGD